MNKLFKWIGILEMPLMLGLLSVIHYNMDSMVLSWLFAMICIGRLLLNIASDNTCV
jgi:hypothetical protein